ncbi:nuclear cap-binding protein subunit 3 [Acyrthosiphon pisum]|uniref:Nuclear cap-binding protein subunit 3 n=1 Tax=Acyrthosiphon pisum TaxID=7029 RepID=A0A8R1W272_ACYPI|nr:nuclear cap-binding protein subunit 3 [Acyrthosiphon pisum]|eukprot:XP_001950154.1 PREDICTED: nuclear cap-binding protein subunit 3-like [Acyrthosiphon pisum]
MADSDTDDILSEGFLEPGELLDSDDNQPADNSTSARTSQPMAQLNRPKLNRNTFQAATASNADQQLTSDITDKQVQYILNSLGMNKNNKDIQLNALHLHGVMGMTTKDIIDYFDKYDPKFLEWVSNSECNVVWLDDRMPTKALLDLTRPIRELRHITSAVNDELNNEHGALNENQNDDHMDQDDVLVSEDYVSCVGYELPPGMWRKAIKPHEKSKCILMRYSTVYDKQDVKNKSADVEDGDYELFSHESRKRKFIPVINHPDIGDEMLKDDVRWKLAKNPGINTWTAIAKTWSQYDNAMDNAKYKSKVRTPSPPPPTSSSGAASEDDDDDYNDARYRESKIPRMRMYADDETQATTRKRLNSSSNSRHQVNIANDLRERLNGRLVSAKVAKAIRAAKAHQYLDDESLEVDIEDVNDEEYTDIPFSRATRRDIPRRQYLHEDDGDYTSDEDVYEKRNVKSRLGPHRKHSHRYNARSVSPLQIQINNDKYYKRINRR